ncbi:MAG TPA: hypothetical protein VIV82_08495, partial [Verrucomicrobiae bacterium]
NEKQRKGSSDKQREQRKILSARIALRMVFTLSPADECERQRGWPGRDANESKQADKIFAPGRITRETSDHK